MATSPAISMGDLVRAVGALNVHDESTIDEIAGLLGMTASSVEGSAAAVLTPPLPAIDEPLPASDRPEQDRSDSSQPHRPAPEGDEDAPAQRTDVEPMPLDPIARRPPRAVPPLDQLLATPPLDETGVDPSLFVSGWQRGILTAAISTAGFDGEIDVARIVEAIANGRAVQRLPRLPIHTTRRGLQILIDIADGMRPFAADVAQLERLLRFTAGDDGVQLLRFDRAPLDGAGRATRRTWLPYAPPPAGTPVLVLSDFGLATSVPSAVPLAWQQVAAVLRQQGSPLLALTPFPPARWPAWLTGICSPIQWDRPANAAAARRAAERAARMR